MNKFKLSKLPFDIGVYKKRNKQLPLELPFFLTFDPKIGLITQKINNKIKDALKKYYTFGGYASTPLGEGIYATKQANGLYKLIKQAIKFYDRKIEKMSFLEIGSSYGYLLYLLKKGGAQKILGIEPGDEGVIGAKKYDIPLIQDFFPSKLLTKKFDLIFNHAVLEHIENPLFILKNIYKHLNKNGIVFIAVPDCEKKLMVGDISIIAHQHINYFTRNSLKTVLKKSGFTKIKIINVKERALLIGYGKKKESKKHKCKVVKSKQNDKKIFQMFTKTFLKNIKIIQKIINQFEKENKSIGLYAPCGNLRGLLKFIKEPRIFNSDSFKHNKYITKCTNAIESKEKLLKNPVDILFIAPIDYDIEIHEDLIKNKLKNTKLISLKKIYEENSGIKYVRSDIE
ncbi:class I SAM-dependent methyltransferase [bacterium]|nr:class I SAM-dependent methyltransferase [bacterium]